jgi:hypothetical protein
VASVEASPMADINPVIRHLLLCDDVRPDPNQPTRFDILGVCGLITSRQTPPFPLRHPSLCVFVQFTGARGGAEVQVVVRDADTDAAVFSSQPHRVRLPVDPLQLMGLKLVVKDSPFPRAGLYWVQLRWNGQVVAQEPLLLR